MSAADIPNVILALRELDKSPLLYEALVQGIVNHISLVQVARARMAAERFVDGGGASLVDPDRVYDYGISQGGIFGGTITAYDPVIERGVVQMGAMNDSMLLERSVDWPLHRDVLESSYPNAIDVSLILALLQSQWDTTDPVSVADAVLTGGIPVPPGNEPPPENDVHSSVRRRQATIDMMRTFYDTGEIVSACGETGCDCTLDACGPAL